MKKKLIAIGLAAIMILGISGIALAALGTPDPLTVFQIDAYQSVVNTNDQLYIATFEIGENITAYDAGEAFIFRFYSDGVEIAATTPYPYYNDGYSQGVIGFYFEASDADLPNWAADNVTIYLVGNPAFEWTDGDPPSTSLDVVTSYNTSKVLVGAKVRTLARDLGATYGVDLREQLEGVYKLTAAGEDYFGNTIPNLRTIAPELYTSGIIQPYFPDETKATTYADEVEDRWLTSGNSTFDMTDMGTLFGVSREWFTGILYVALSIGLLFAAGIGVSNLRTGGVGTGVVLLRPAVFLFGALLILGGFMGFLNPIVSALVAMGGVFAIVYAILYKGSV